MKKRFKSYIYLAALTFLIILLSVFAYDLLTNPTNQTNELNNTGICQSDNCVSRVIDGDTFELMSGEIVRLICVDAPEQGDAGADEAGDFLGSLILGKEVRIEKDLSDRDVYGRLLRYVWVNDSDNEEIFVNKEIVKEGFGEVWVVEPDVRRCWEIKR